ncbi:MAG: hypothetical protein OEQ81_07845 [Flavobacteriaceae bacterium]|nr:hypothetical protein [Flavobacteriaceae bacterium]
MIKNWIFMAALLFLPLVSSAQCAMCRAVIESGQDASLAEGINNGIVYLMAIPYILIGVLFYFIFRKPRQG